MDWNPETERCELEALLSIGVSARPVSIKRYKLKLQEFNKLISYLQRKLQASTRDARLDGSGSLIWNHACLGILSLVSRYLLFYPSRSIPRV